MQLSRSLLAKERIMLESNAINDERKLAGSLMVCAYTDSVQVRPVAYQPFSVFMFFLCQITSNEYLTS